jgi:hypothetical protein
MPRPKDYWHSAAVEAADQSNVRIWGRRELQELQRRLTDERLIPRSTSLEGLEAVLTERGKLRRLELRPVLDANQDDEGSSKRRPFRRLVWGDVSTFEIALSLRPRSYLSHGSAMVLNELAGNFNDRVFVNQEQTPKPPPTGILTQESVDRAFRSSARASTYVFRHDTTEIVLLNGKNTEDFGVTETTYGGTIKVRTTGVARTLVDIAVRPGYAGGAGAVLDAYRSALARNTARVLVDELEETLDALSHVYPYHQAVGFYLEQAGADEAITAPLRARGLMCDFYLDYAMESAQHDPKWRIYYPAGLL